MTAYCTAQEVLDQVNGLRSLSTLNKWANFIQKECVYQFHYESIGNSTTYSRKTRVYSQEECQKFQQVANLIPKIGLESALRQLFDPYVPFDKWRHHELLEEMSRQMETKLIEQRKKLQAVARQSQQIQQSYTALQQRVTTLEKQLDTDNTSSGWFRRKR